MDFLSAKNKLQVSGGTLSTPPLPELLVGWEAVHRSVLAGIGSAATFELLAGDEADSEATIIEALTHEI